MPSSLSALASITTLALRVGAAKTHLSEEPERSAPALEALVREGLAGRARSRKAMLACAIALAQEDGEAWIAELAREAVAQGLPVVSAILQDAKPHCTARRLPDPHVAGHLLASFFDATGTPARSESPRVLADPPPSCDARDVGIPGRWYLVTRHLMEPLLLHPDPVVVRRLLRARSLRLREALIVASRRPTSPSIVREIVASLRWIGRIEVREALVANPFVSTGIALKLLATVSIPAQRGLARGAVHPTLVGVASLLAHVEP